MKPVFDETEFLKIIGKHSRDVFSIFDPSFKRHYVNDSITDLVGYTPAEILGMDVNSIVHPNDLVPVGEKVIDSLAKKEICLVEHRLLHKNGSIVWVEVLVRPILSSNGELRWILTCARNITDRKQSEAELDYERKLREQLFNISNLAHEIRTPLQAIIGISELLLKGEHKTEQHQLIQTLNSSVKSTLNLFNNVLDFTRVKEKKVSLSISNLAIRHFITEIVSPYQFTAEAKNIGLSLDIKERVPHNIGTDPLRLTQIVSNLLSNAVKFTTKGYVKLTVDVDHFNDADILVIEIMDTGVGISSDDLHQIYEPFQQGQAALYSHPSGSGLGLFIVKSLIDIFGGTIKVKSTPQIGTTFTIKLPIQLTTTQSGAKAILRHSLKVLYIDDVESNRVILSQQLSDVGIECMTAFDVDSALHLLLKNNIDIVLLDLHLSDHDGLDIAEIISLHESSIPIIGFTGDTSQEIVNKTMQAGIKEIITKPSGIEYIASRISYWQGDPYELPKHVDLKIYRDLFFKEPSKYREAIQLLTSDYISVSEALLAGSRSRNKKNIKKSLHKIIPISKQINFTKFIEVSEKIERALKNSEWKKIIRYSIYLRALTNKVIKEEFL